ncbi:MAG: hypothetical protein DHS20C11_32800 [Lysobacteraceae bacterium]|nr:MAG: hypothetical protein DHS20C11_32800 [Xanthomonadaceae bacterium]
MKVLAILAAGLTAAATSSAQVLVIDDFADPDQGGSLNHWTEVVSGTAVIEHDASQGALAPGVAKLWTWAPSGQSTAWRCTNIDDSTDYALSASVRMDLELVAACSITALLVDGMDCPNQAPILQVREAAVLPQLSWHRRSVLLNGMTDPTPGDGLSVALLLDHDRTSGSSPAECLFDDLMFASDAFFSGLFE